MKKTIITFVGSAVGFVTGSVLFSYVYENLLRTDISPTPFNLFASLVVSGLLFSSIVPISMKKYWGQENSWLIWGLSLLTLFILTIVTYVTFPERR